MWVSTVVAIGLAICIVGNTVDAKALDNGQLLEAMYVAAVDEVAAVDQTPQNLNLKKRSCTTTTAKPEESRRRRSDSKQPTTESTGIGHGLTLIDSVLDEVVSTVQGRKDEPHGAGDDSKTKSKRHSAKTTTTTTKEP